MGPGIDIQSNGARSEARADSPATADPNHRVLHGDPLASVSAAQTATKKAAIVNDNACCCRVSPIVIDPRLERRGVELCGRRGGGARVIALEPRKGEGIRDRKSV